MYSLSLCDLRSNPLSPTPMDATEREKQYEEIRKRCFDVTKETEKGHHFLRAGYTLQWICNIALLRGVRVLGSLKKGTFVVYCWILYVVRYVWKGWDSWRDSQLMYTVLWIYFYGLQCLRGVSYANVITGANSRVELWI